MMGNEKETVSIIMAAYNAEKTIGAAIRSVLAQTYPDWELLVINDASGDRTVELVRSFIPAGYGDYDGRELP